MCQVECVTPSTDLLVTGYRQEACVYIKIISIAEFVNRKEHVAEADRVGIQVSEKL